MDAYQWKREKLEENKYTCPIHKTALLIGDRWTLFILREFLYNNKKQKFNQLLRALKPISSRTLSIKLKKMVEYELIERKEILSNIPCVDYKITKKGESLKQALQEMGNWHKKHFKS